MDEEAAHNKVFPCSTCHEEVEDHDAALMCDVCEQWEHIECTKVCDRPSVELYTLLSVTSSKALVFTCTACRRKGTLARQLAEAQITLSSMRTQLSIYERLLQEWQRLVECMGAEKDALQLENTRLHDQLADARRASDERGVSELSGSGLQVTKPLSVLAPEFVSASARQPGHVVQTLKPMTASSSGGRRKLPSVPETTATCSISHISPPTTLHTTPARSGSSLVSRRERLTLDAASPQAQPPSNFKHPTGFKELRDRVRKFTGDGKEDFEVWLTDFCEATGDCEWTDVMRAQWFSWFLTGSAKSTWQRTLNQEDKASWTSIVQAYKSHYGVHMDPRTAYLRCHELQYQDFKSAQSLLEAMKDYQRMAPDQLSNNNLISILWNKVPFTLQKEVGEIKDWSLQDLLQRLLRAEARLAERERRSRGNDWGKARKSGGYNSGSAKRDLAEKSIEKPPVNKGTPNGEQSGQKGQDTRGAGEFSLKHVKCYKCDKKGHVANMCPNTETPKGSRRVTTEESTDEKGTRECENEQTNYEELWFRVVSADRISDQGNPPECPTMVGPTYKVNVTVEGYKIRALLDHGSQVSIVRRQMLPRIQELNNWPTATCVAKNMPLRTHPVGATGQRLGALGVVVLNVQVETTGKTCPIPCFVLDSSQPLRRGELKDCGVLFGTNTLVEHGFHVSYSDGTTIEPTPRDGAERSSANVVNVLQVTLGETVHIKPSQMKWTKAVVDAQGEFAGTWLISPNEEQLAKEQCDMTEALLEDVNTMIRVPLHNWGSYPIVVKKGTVIGNMEEVAVATRDDPVWVDDQTDEIVRVCQSESAGEGRDKKLCSELQFGNTCTSNVKDDLRLIVRKYNDVFALTDDELGLVRMVISSVNAALE